MNQKIDKKVIISWGEQMDKEREEAEIEYKKLVKEDEGKDFLDILPNEFKSFKRSIIKRQILNYIKKCTVLLNNAKNFDGKNITEKDVTRFIIRGTDYSNFYLAYKFVPRLTDPWMKYASEWQRKNNKSSLPKNYYEVCQKTYEEEFTEYHELNHALQILKQYWKQYQDRQKVKKGEVIDSWDIEKDGFPRTGRGNMCHLFIPVKGTWVKNKKGSFELLNPRINKTVTYKITGYKKEEDIYSCINEKGKTVFLAKWEEINDCWDALFDTNKEIFAGWWNKTMILK